VGLSVAQLLVGHYCPIDQLSTLFVALSVALLLVALLPVVQMLVVHKYLIRDRKGRDLY
jgi:quinol-cytochrome oxidoreductase complex cytochrome b subunit